MASASVKRSEDRAAGEGIDGTALPPTSESINDFRKKTRDGRKGASKVVGCLAASFDFGYVCVCRTRLEKTTIDPASRNVRRGVI